MHKKVLFQFSGKARRTVAALGWSCLGALAVAGGGAQAATLTPTAISDGYGLTTVVSGIPNTGFNGVGPVGVITTSGNIMIAGYASGQVRVFGDTNGQVWTAGAAAGFPYGGNNIAGLATLGGNFYGVEQASAQVVKLDAAGNQTSVMAGIPFATSIIGDSATNRLYVGNTSAIYAIDPGTNAVTLFTNAHADGLALSGDGSILYAAINNGAFANHILGFNTATSAQVFDSGTIAGGIDGTAFGAGSLAGNLFVNTNGGTLVEVNLTTLAQTVLFTGGSRGDFVWVDTNGVPGDSINGTLLITQTDSVLRLTAPAGGGFVVGNVPEPETYAMLIAGLGMLGFTARRRKHKAV